MTAYKEKPTPSSGFTLEFYQILKRINTKFFHKLLKKIEGRFLNLFYEVQIRQRR